LGSKANLYTHTRFFIENWQNEALMWCVPKLHSIKDCS